MRNLIFRCERCGEDFTGNSYRVTSETDGLILLDLIVCDDCCLAATELGLETTAIDVRRYAVQ
jgi:hypothetical protein